VLPGPPFGLHTKVILDKLAVRGVVKSTAPQAHANPKSTPDSILVKIMGALQLTVHLLYHRMVGFGALVLIFRLLHPCGWLGYRS
jgi:hypothetical protein